MKQTIEQLAEELAEVKAYALAAIAAQPDPAMAKKYTDAEMSDVHSKGYALGLRQKTSIDPAMAGDEITYAEIMKIASDYMEGGGWSQWRVNPVKFARALLERVQPANGESALTKEETEGFLAAYEHFGDGVDTTTDEVMLMKFVRLGLMEVEAYYVTQSGEVFYAAAKQGEQP
jgi:hypothetical protein